MQNLSRDNTVTELGPDAIPASTIDFGEKVQIETARPLGIRMRSLDDPRPPRQNVNPCGITLRLEVPKAVWAAADQ